MLVCGGRKWGDAYPILRELRALPDTVTLCIHGDAPGADTLAGGIAESLGFVVRAVPAHRKHTKNCKSDCNEYGGKSAIPIRNRKMLAVRPDIILAFHTDIGASKGTADMVALGRAAKIKTRVFSE